MKKILLIALSVLLTIGLATGQKRKDNGGSGGGNNNNDGGGGSGDGSCMSSATAMASKLAGAYHTKLLSSSKIDAVSLEIMPVIGYTMPMDAANDNSYYNILPRIKGNYGAFSVDVLLDYWADTEDFSINPYKVGHGLVEFNVIPNNMFKLAIGQGVLYNIDSEGIFHESFFGIETAVMKRTYMVNIDGRFAYDYVNSSPVYLSIEVKGGYKVAGFSHAAVYVNAGISYTDINNGFKNIVPFAGLNLVLK